MRTTTKGLGLLLARDTPLRDIVCENTGGVVGDSAGPATNLGFPGVKG
jgi:hypothetical protein